MAAHGRNRDGEDNGDRDATKVQVSKEHLLFVPALRIFTTLTWDEINEALWGEFGFSETGPPWPANEVNCGKNISAIKTGRKGPKILAKYEKLVRGEMLSLQGDALVRGFVEGSGFGRAKPIWVHYARLPRPLGSNPVDTAHDSTSNQRACPELAASSSQRGPAQPYPRPAFQGPRDKSPFLRQGVNPANPPLTWTSTQAGHHESYPSPYPQGPGQQESPPVSVSQQPWPFPMALTSQSTHTGEGDPRSRTAMPRPEESELHHPISPAQQPETPLQDLNRRLQGLSVLQAAAKGQHDHRTGPRDQTIDPPWLHPAMAHWRDFPWIRDAEPQGTESERDVGISTQWTQGGQSIKQTTGQPQEQFSHTTA